MCPGGSCSRSAPYSARRVWDVPLQSVPDPEKGVLVCLDQCFDPLGSVRTRLSPGGEMDSNL